MAHIRIRKPSESSVSPAPLLCSAPLLRARFSSFGSRLCEYVMKRVQPLKKNRLIPTESLRLVKFLKAKDNPEEFDIEALNGNESEVIELDLMLGIADLHTPEAVAAAEASVSGYQPPVPLFGNDSETDSDSSSSDEDGDNDNENEENDGEKKKDLPSQPQRSKSGEDDSDKGSTEIGATPSKRGSRHTVLGSGPPVRTRMWTLGEPKWGADTSMDGIRLYVFRGVITGIARKGPFQHPLDHRS
ncbi:hypothetical protein CRG98_030376 [Punica granatum]|uniref:Uncharacterized protein n=1 Tax=Punica granatum TaxID=22663 RepID=A0A2I0IZ00_PUNGR|nr:hypothetical protein CRG98_030376 [Punica granatum]